jgi:hypothetical protein
MERTRTIEAHRANRSAPAKSKRARQRVEQTEVHSACRQNAFALKARANLAWACFRAEGAGYFSLGQRPRQGS